jgi:predicted aspartyl protease
MEIEFPYKEEESRTFGIVKRPRMTIRIFSRTKGIWIPIKDVLVDTGADSAVLPRFIGDS